MANLNRLIERLCDADIDFVIVGGFAATLHGSSLLTRDVDVCAVLSQANVEKLRDVLKDLKPVHRMTTQKLSFLDNPSPGASLRNLYLETELGAVDILGSITGVGDYERVRASSIEIQLFGRRCRVMSLDDLSAVHRFQSHPRDRSVPAGPGRGTSADVRIGHLAKER